MSNKMRNEGSLTQFLRVGYESVPCKEKSVVSSQLSGAQRGRRGVRSSTWITVRTLDVSKSEANSL